MILIRGKFNIKDEKLRKKLIFNTTSTVKLI
jgi:hypothetical protein